MNEEEATRASGRWYFDNLSFKTVCSHCGEGEWKGYIPTPEEAAEWMPFCPKCGARMTEESEVEKMTRAELMNLVGKKIHVYFKDGERGIYGTLGYVDEFSEKYEFRKPGYFFIGNTLFLVTHVRKVEL